MSNLIDAVRSELTGRRFPARNKFPLRLLEVDTNYTKTEDHLTYEYDVSVTIRTRTRGKEGSSFDTKIHCCQYLAHHIFGEFKEHLFEIREAIHNGDEATALEWLDKMEKGMFEV